MCQRSFASLKKLVWQRHLPNNQTALWKVSASLRIGRWFADNEKILCGYIEFMSLQRRWRVRLRSTRPGCDLWSFASPSSYNIATPSGLHVS
mmetsp:Transcript_26320/g.41120  ORF Transcript_26320/g.41120 Transcript_26320/m.41120 type:complete len:92 (+) Transcript_26320:438-713(+)